MPESFNRTFLVLKGSLWVTIQGGYRGFNRTFLVLKGVVPSISRGRASSFNRTFLVLKARGWIAWRSCFIRF